MDIRFSVEITERGGCYEVHVSRPGKAGMTFETDYDVTLEHAIQELGRDMVEEPTSYSR